MLLPFLFIAGLLSAVIYRLQGGQKGWQEQSRGLPPGTLSRPVTPPQGVITSSPAAVVGQLLPARPIPYHPPGMGSDIGADLALATAGPPLKPEAERLLALLVLFAKDKKFPAGQKRYLSVPTALEAVRLAEHLGLHRTARAIRKDGRIPIDEYLPGRAVPLRTSVISYARTGKA